MRPSSADPCGAGAALVAGLAASLRELDARIRREESRRAHVEFDNVIGIELLRARRRNRSAH